MVGVRGGISMNTKLFSNLKRLSHNHFHEIWQHAKSRKFDGLPSEDQMLARIMLQHEDEYYNQFEFSDLLFDHEYDPDADINPFLHILLHLIIENQLEAKIPREVHDFYQTMKKKKLSHHECIHVLCNILLPFIFYVLKEKKPFDYNMYRSLLKKYRRVNPEEIVDNLEEDLDSLYTNINSSNQKKQNNSEQEALSDIDHHSIWQFEELEQYLTEHLEDNAIDYKVIHLFPPDIRQQLDSIIENHLWEGVLTGLSPSHIGIYELDETFPISRTKDDYYHEFACRCLEFVLEDPKRPIKKIGQSPAWYVRVNITCTPSNYMINTELIISFPDDFSMAKLNRLLKNDIFMGMPPTLHYETYCDHKSAYILSFSKGNGYEWGKQTYEDANQHIAEVLSGHVQLINIIDKLEKDFKNSKVFNELEKALIKTYQAY